MIRKTIFVVILVAGLILGANFTTTTRAVPDEGMWTPDNLPTAQLKQKYNFTPTSDWVARVQRSSGRTEICSGSFVSADGLIMTNHHCGEEEVQKLSTAKNNLYANGFYAPTKAQELKTGITFRVLDHIDSPLTDVGELTCEKVSFYQGAVIHNYCYKVYTDVRLVFAPEKKVGFFGGDADNFEYPRYDLDVTFLRAYENGRPAKTPIHFKWSKSGAKEGELIFVSGHPGRTERLMTSSALATERDIRVPYILALARRKEKAIQAYMSKGPEERRKAESDLFEWQNIRKLYVGKMKGLQDPELMRRKTDKEAESLAAAMAKSPALGQELKEGRELVDKAEKMPRPNPVQMSKEAAAIEQQGYAKIADVMFQVYGTTLYPDATFTLRLSFGTMEGYKEGSKPVPSTTTLGGAYKHSVDFHNAGDYQLPARWLMRKRFVNLGTPLDFVSNLDITGGNSGSPVFNKDLEIVGLIFDGNRQSLTSDYDYNYDPNSRAVAVHSAGIIEALKKIYRANTLVQELTR